MRRRLVLLAGIGLIILAIALIISWASIFETVQSPNQAKTILLLHTSGHQIMDANNKVVYLRGIGRAGDLESLSGTWGGQGGALFDSGEKWQADTATLTQEIDQTFACYQTFGKLI